MIPEWSLLDLRFLIVLDKDGIRRMSLYQALAIQVILESFCGIC